MRHPDGDVVRKVYERLLLCAKAGALATETKLTVKFEGGTREILPNSVLSQVSLQNLKSLNDMSYSADELQFALKLRETFEERPPLESIKQVFDRNGSSGKGSTDVGDVSWLVPTTGFSTACWVPGTPAHSWQAVAGGGTSIGRKGMHLAARVLERQNPSLERRRVQDDEDGVWQERPDETRPAGRRPQDCAHRSGSGYRSP